MHPMAPLFDFSSVAVVGASDNAPGGARGYRTLETLGFTGRYYPVNSRADTVQGMKAYPSVSSLPEVPDMVLIAIPRRAVPAVVDECADRGVKAAVIISAGFLERDAEGAELQARITATARTRGPLLVGPNCLGLISVVNHCAAWGGNPPTHPGNVAVISNSGGLMIDVMNAGTSRGIGFSHLVNSGNEAGVTAADLLDFFVADRATDVILAILETVRDPSLFIAASDRARDARKPIVVLKMGRSAKGARSVSTHTGALAGSDAVYSSLFRQKGIVQVYDLDELVDMGILLSAAIPVLRTRRLERAGIIDISGGGKELLCDTCAAAGVPLPELSAGGAAALQAALQDEYGASNPLDTGGQWADARKKEVYPAALEVFAAEPEIDVVGSCFTIPRTVELGGIAERIQEMKKARAAHPDRLFVVLCRTMWSPDWEAVIRDCDVPFLQGYGRGPQALARLAEYSRFLHGPDGRAQGPAAAQPSRLSQSGRPLDEIESKALLTAVGIPVVETVQAATPQEAVLEAKRLGYPVVLKVLAPEIVHKSDQGGVRLGLVGAQSVRRAFAELKGIAAAAEATFRGVTVQPMAAPGVEIVLGAQRDPQFGPAVMCGVGGVFIEVLDDVALRLAPVEPDDAEAMLNELRGRRLLDGLDRPAIADALCRLADLMLSRTDIVSIDVNPVLAYRNGLLAVDARIQLAPDADC